VSGPASIKQHRDRGYAPCAPEAGHVGAAVRCVAGRSLRCGDCVRLGGPTKL